MKFGDIVINEWASDDNPQKVLMVISHRKMVECLSVTGVSVAFHNDKHLRLTRVGSVDFSTWRTFASNLGAT